jgi:hypothetical protein
MASALTRFGQICREIRASHHKNMGDQAEALGCEVHHISAIEMGKIAASDQYVEKLRMWLNLTDQQYGELQRRRRSNVIAFPTRHSGSNNSSSMRLFRRISKMDPMEIRNFRKKIEDKTECLTTL